jgi:hypothetical protein
VLFLFVHFSQTQIIHSAKSCHPCHNYPYKYQPFTISLTFPKFYFIYLKILRGLNFCKLSKFFTRNTLDGLVTVFKLSRENTSNIHFTKTNMSDNGGSLSSVRQFYKYHKLLAWNLSKMDLDLHQKRKNI